METTRISRIKNGIRFLRNFKDKSDTVLYKKSVLGFINLVEQELSLSPPVSDDDIKEAFFIKEEVV